VPDELGVRNELAGGVTGAVVQAGSIQQVTLAGAVLPGLVPRQLPPTVGDFVGRVQQLAVLDALLSATNGNGGDAGAVVISAVDGLPGVGKTALAVFGHTGCRIAFPMGRCTSIFGVTVLVNRPVPGRFSMVFSGR
jgi:hypothetical protein